MEIRSMGGSDQARRMRQGVIFDQGQDLYKSLKPPPNRIGDNAT
jgi:hypothetical protein